jgi:gliding motility-associated-like protein
MLNGSVSGTAIQFQWSPPAFISNNMVLSPIVFPATDMQYTLTATSTVGCGEAKDMVTVKVYNDVFIPDAFSPNNDGKNDNFKIIAADGYQLLKFQVYNRWGQLIYQANDFSKGWDGRYKELPQPQDTYIYLLQLRSSNGKLIKRQGTLTLIR